MSGGVTDRPGAWAGIGDTPVVRLGTPPDSAEIWVKLEGSNPTGLHKDRMALAMIEGAERSGRLQPGQTVVEHTGGSTGSSLALVRAIKSHPLRIASSTAIAPEKIQTMRAFGADVELVDSPEGITPTSSHDARPGGGDRGRDRRVRHGPVLQHRDDRRLPAAGPGARGAPDGRIDAIVIHVGTAGCYLGTCRALRAAIPAIHGVAVEPGESPVLSGGTPGTHRIEGGGVGFLPPLLTMDAVDEVIAVPTAVAMETARTAARTEGIWSGPSTGANLAAARQVAARLGPGHRAATIAVDSGLMYLGGALYR